MNTQYARSFIPALAMASFILLSAFPTTAQSPTGAPAPNAATPQASQGVLLSGNTRPEANAQNDRGAVADDLPMEHMLLQLKRSPEREQALQQFINELQTAGSPNFHHWITAEEFGARFGVSPGLRQSHRNLTI